MDRVIQPKKALSGILSVPGDKSISHRSVMFGSIAKGKTRVSGFLTGDDCLSTIACFRKLGVEINVDGTRVEIEGKGLHGLTAPTETLDVGNSGTTMRLISGILAAQPFTTRLTGDASIQKRPMDRIAKPLRQMGADITGTGTDKLLAPLTIHGKPLKGTVYPLPVASAQVKSAVLLAGLYAEGETVVIEPEATRNHTELMLGAMGANIRREGEAIYLQPAEELYAQDITVPGDISSAAYFMVAASVCPNSRLTITGVGVNPTRTGILDVLRAMGANITLHNERVLCGEPIADMTIESAPLHGTIVQGGIIPRLIDEIPVLAVAACYAQGETVIRNAEELKVKESNRIQAMVTELGKLGADLTETEDGMIIHGGAPLHGGVTQSHHDHRIAMSMAVAGLLGRGDVVIQGAECVDISFPGFYDMLSRL